MGIKFLFPGALTTIQDLGRYGFQYLGISPSGAMDRLSVIQANTLVGNPLSEAVLEFTLVGPMLTFTESAVAAITGADMDARLNKVPIAPGSSFTVTRGDELVFGSARSGCRAYLAVRGGFDIPLVLGSRSTSLKYRLGGLDGRALRAGDELAFRQAGTTEGFVPSHSPSSLPSGHVTARVISGPQEEYFTEKGKNIFYTATYKITPEADRMGYRLSGPSVESVGSVDIISDGVTFGSVQIPPSGMPIIMMADHQTTGGYAKIATVIQADLPLLAQLKPGDTVSFQKISVQEAQKLFVRTFPRTSQ